MRILAIKNSNNNMVSVDDEDFERLSSYEWRLDGKYIVRTHNKLRDKNSRRLYASKYEKIRVPLANEVLRIYNCVIDHKDRNPLNNTKENLRVSTSSQNNANRAKMANSTSKYKGVSWCEKLGKWKVGTTVNNVKFHIGYYHDEIEAAKAYDAFALSVFKEFANINFK